MGLLLRGRKSRAERQRPVALGVRQRRVVLPVAAVRERQADGGSSQDVLPVMLVVTGAGQCNYSCKE